MMALKFCINHNYLKTDNIGWKKVKHNVGTLLFRLKKPAFIAVCPDCKCEQDLRNKFLLR